MSEKDIDHIPCARVKKGSIIVIEDRPCKVMSETTSKTGKHGHAKKIVTGIDIFTEKKHIMTFSTADTLEVPIVRTKDYQMLGLDDDGYLDLLDDSGNQISEYRLPDNDLGSTIRTKYDNGDDLIITVKTALGESMIVDHKVEKS